MQHSAHAFRSTWRAAVVHVGRGDRDVPKGRHTKLANVFRAPRNLMDAGIRRRIRNGTRYVVQTRIDG